MKASVFPLIGLAALALTQCGGGGGDFSTFDMKAESFLNSRKYFAFENNCGYCVVKPQDGANSWSYGASVGPDTGDASNTVRCFATLLYTNDGYSSTLTTEDTSTPPIRAIYTYNDDGTATLTLMGNISDADNAARVLLGEDVTIPDQEEDNTYIDSTPGVELECTITVQFSGDLAGTYNSRGTYNNTEGVGTGTFRLYRH